MVKRLPPCNLNDPTDARIFLLKLEEIGKLELEGDESIEDMSDDEVLDAASLVFVQCYPVPGAGVNN